MPRAVFTRKTIQAAVATALSSCIGLSNAQSTEWKAASPTEESSTELGFFLFGLLAIFTFFVLTKSVYLGVRKRAVLKAVAILAITCLCVSIMSLGFGLGGIGTDMLSWVLNPAHVWTCSASLVLPVGFILTMLRSYECRLRCRVSRS